MIGGSIHSNPQFIIRLYDTGDIRTIDQNDVKIYGNPTTGEPLIPTNKQFIKGLKNHFGPKKTNLSKSVCAHTMPVIKSKTIYLRIS